MRDTASRLQPVLDNLLQDLRYAVRGLRKSPVFTLTVILTLGLGIGANAAMFGIIDRLMFRPFPYMRDQASVNRPYLTSLYRGKASTDAGPSIYTRYLDLRKWSTSFSQGRALRRARWPSAPAPTRASGPSAW